MCSWFDLDWLNCMSSWFDAGGLSLVCSWLDSDYLSQMIDLYNVIGQVIGSGLVQ